MVQEIEIPLDLKRVVLLGAEETKLGDKKGALKQYRKGNLHIREYADRFTVHTDKVDPRTDPMGHLIHDAQEVLIGLRILECVNSLFCIVLEHLSYLQVLSLQRPSVRLVSNLKEFQFLVS